MEITTEKSCLVKHFSFLNCIEYQLKINKINKKEKFLILIRINTVENPLIKKNHFLNKNISFTTKICLKFIDCVVFEKF